MSSPQERMIEAIEALIADIAGFKQEWFPDRIMTIAYGDDLYIPEDLRELVDRDSIRERIARAIFDLDTMGRDENDFLFFMASLQSPFQASLAINNKGQNVDVFINNIFAQHDKPVKDLKVAEVIAFQIGNESPKYLDAVDFILNKAEDVPEAYTLALKDDLDEFAKSMSITLEVGEDGEPIYDIQKMIDQVCDNHNEAQEA